jgi:hypothetical protein
MAKAKKLPAAWYVETTADGGAHYGRLVAGKVIAGQPCGREFVPLDYATRKGTVIQWNEPVDQGHACPACWTAYRKAIPEPAEAVEA